MKRNDQNRVNMNDVKLMIGDAMEEFGAMIRVPPSAPIIAAMQGLYQNLLKSMHRAYEIGVEEGHRQAREKANPEPTKNNVIKFDAAKAMKEKK